MSEKTNIEWANHTGNPWIGCTKVSPGCGHCYAATLDERKFSRTLGGATPENPISHWGKGAPRVRTKAFWKDALKWNKRAGESEIAHNDETNLGKELGRYVRPRVFPSLCDWLDDEVPIEWLADFLQLIQDTPNLDWLLLTKRPELFNARISKVMCYLEDSGKNDGVKDDDDSVFEMGYGWIIREPRRIPSNVWIGVSVEDQKRADERIPILLSIPAKIRFLSVEPLLSSVSMTKIGHDYEYTDALRGQHRQFNSDGQCKESKTERVNWCIVGGESGDNFRDCGVEAITNVANQCVAAGVPCFVKQDAAHKPGQQRRISNETWTLKQFPA